MVVGTPGLNAWPAPPFQVFNEINAHKIRDEYNVFEGIETNYIFIGVLVVTSVCQVIITEVLPTAIFSISRLSW